METTNFDLRITKAQAEEILKKGLDVKHKFNIMCKEFCQSQNRCDCGNDNTDACLDCGKEKCECGDDNYHTESCDINAWNGICDEDLNEDGTMDDDYQTFEIYY